jgi:hypothetical protein
MTPRAALAVLSSPRAEGESADQHELDRFVAIEVLANALELREEAVLAHAVVQTLIAKDAQQLRLFQMLEGNGDE